MQQLNAALQLDALARLDGIELRLQLDGLRLAADTCE